MDPHKKKSSAFFITVVVVALVFSSFMFKLTVEDYSRSHDPVSLAFSGAFLMAILIAIGILGRQLYLAFYNSSK